MTDAAARLRANLDNRQSIWIPVRAADLRAVLDGRKAMDALLLQVARFQWAALMNDGSVVDADIIADMIADMIEATGNPLFPPYTTEKPVDADKNHTLTSAEDAPSA